VSQQSEGIEKMTVTILADSINTSTGDRLTTFLLEQFPKCLLAEVNTHRALSRNWASARAMPILKVIEQVQCDPFIPQWTGHAKGMTGTTSLKKETVRRATTEWLHARDQAVDSAKRMLALGIAKQNANRILEPWMTVPGVISGTEWANFFKLRTAPDAQPEFRAFAITMCEAMAASEPKPLNPGEWHIPLDPGDKLSHEDRLKTSVAMSARGSYGCFTKEPSLENDQRLHDQLLASGHWSPFEHQAQAISERRRRANLVGFASYRYSLGF
jgi:thymidylate synthase ThyX